MSKNTAQINVGRLLEIHVAGYNDMNDIQAMYGQLVNATAKLDHKTVVVVADWRHCKQIGPTAMHGVGSILKDFNNHIAQSAVLASQDSPKSVVQFLDVIRKAGHPSRRLFVNTAELATWIGGYLTAEERTRLTAFLR